MNKEYQEALNCLRDTKCDEINNCEICSLTSYCGHYQCVKTLQEAIDKANKYDEKETPKKPIERLFESNKHFKICPSCWEKNIKNFVYGKYCDECGQRLE